MVQIKELLGRLQQTLAKRGTVGIFALGKFFKIADTDRSNQLDKDEFQVIMIRMRMGLNEEECSALFDYFDRDRSGTISYDEFLKSIRGEMNDFRRRLVMQAYSILDINGDGQITLDEIRQKYNVSPQHPDVQSGKKTMDEVFMEFLMTFEGDSENRGDGIVTPEEFLDYYSNVSSSIDRDDYFELMMNSAWRLGEYAKYSNKDKGAAVEVKGRPARAAPPPIVTGAEQERAVGQAPQRTPQRTPQQTPQQTPLGTPQRQQTPSETSSVRRSRQSAANEITVRMLRDKMKAVLRKRGTRGITSLGKWFKRSDFDKSGQLDIDEFKTVCTRLRLGLPDDKVETLFHGFDHNGNGLVDYEEFLQALRGELNPIRLRVVEQAWKKFDKTGDGQVDMDDIRDVYSAKGHPDVMSKKKTEEEVLLEFIETFEVRGKVDGIITHDEFLEYYKNVSASIDDDQYFVLCVNSAWRMAEYANSAWKQRGTRMEL